VVVPIGLTGTGGYIVGGEPIPVTQVRPARSPEDVPPLYNGSPPSSV